MDLPGANDNLQLLRSRFARTNDRTGRSERGGGIAELTDVLERFLLEERRQASPKWTDSTGGQ